VLIEVLYHKYKHLVFNLALQYTNNVQDAEEVTQDVFVKVFDKLNTFRNEADIKTWIYRITINHSLDFLKSKHRRKRNFIFSIFDIQQELEEYPIHEFNHPGIKVENEEDLKNLMKKIFQLPENQKTVIILLKIEELSQKEVAEIMNLSEGAVESLFQRAKTSLKKLL
jgi:RNA polymerase sigma factor (sigma-70 family)